MAGTHSRADGALLAVHDLRAEPGLLADAVARPAAGTGTELETVRGIIADVRARGDAALVELTRRFDGADVSAPGALRAHPDELVEAWKGLDPVLCDSLETAVRRVRAYHDTPAAAHRYEDEGIAVSERAVPVERAGIYVPGGRADYPSTVLMTVIPAQAAGVRSIAVCVPPRRDGTLPPTVAAAAHLLGVPEVYKVGGAQAIAALAYGTATIAAVDVVVGPGNAYVALAKSEVARDVGVESLAGPSECVVVADAGAPVAAVAADLMAQAEHGPGGFTMLVTWSDDLAAAVVDALAAMVEASPRAEQILSTFGDGGRLVLCRDAAHAIEVANAAAAEHLQLMVADPSALVPLVRSAGAVFCGYDTPVALGDYLAGPSHVLPTAGTARFASALRPADFVKSVHVVTASHDGLGRLGPVAATLARAEGLEAHALSIDVRLDR
ncbi:MAG: histidinol dehydrogenase [Acidimicrobiia bacterium]